MKRTILYIFILTMGFLLNPFLLIATEDANLTKHPLIEKYDKDKDGMIFYTEASEEIQDDFCQYDVNQDGYLDKVEVEAVK